MTHFSLRLIVILLMLLTGSDLSAVPQETSRKAKKALRGKDKVVLFNGKDLSGWVFRARDPAEDPSKNTFSVKDGVIHITGSPIGYMRTKDPYSDYALHVEWRWPAEKGNSGIFIHTQMPDTVPLKVIEVQLAAGNAGDFMCGRSVFMKELIDKDRRVIRKLAPSSEKPVGEWNIMEIVCLGNTVEVTVNGVLQNKGTDLTLDKGHICLQSEGRIIEFRNVFLTRLK